ncbi:MAG: PASTA domain-containing protein [Clostridia bacterium]|nr:PASTA domain-containing protein [Clostridia bacterium]
MRKVSTLYKRRITIVFGLILILLALLCVRLAWIQVVKADEYKAMAIEQQTRDVLVEAKRGDILDRNGSKLATSATCYTVWIRPNELKKSLEDDQVEPVAEKLAKYTHKKKDTILKYMASDDSIVKVAKYISKDDAAKIKEIGANGILLAKGSKRYYPMGNYASQTLGSVTEDNVGRTGIELEYDQYLSGIAGRWIKNSDRDGGELSFGTDDYYAPENGYDVVLTIDQAIQYYVEKAVKKGMAKTHADRIMCIVLDPKSGDVLAMAMNPGFNPNNATEPDNKADKKKFAKYTDKQQVNYLNKMWRNSMVSDTYEPGSTFKLITAASALEEGVVNTKENLYCKGSIRVEDYTLHCNDGAKHKNQQLRDAVGNSCNTAHVRLALRLGEKKFYDYLALFGITDLTNIDLPGEAYAQVQPRANIGPVELATMGFGQGIAVTPIQLVTAISAIGNKGIEMQPRLVKELRDENGKTVKKFSPVKIRRVISEETAKEMCKIMEYEVSKGGGGSAKIAGYRVGGKTGTANKANSTGYSNSVYSSFICMAPMNDPQVEILVICDNPKGLIYGSYTAAPIAKEIMEQTVKYLGIAPSYTAAEKKALKNKTYKVPSITGMTTEKALGVIGGYNVKSKVVGKKNKVVDQYPKAGDTIKAGGTVYLYTE